MALHVDVAAPTPRKLAPAMSEMPLTPPQSPPPEKRVDNRQEPSDLHIPDNYVQHTIATVPPLPPIKLRNILNEIQWISFTALTAVPIIALYGAFTTKLRWETALFSVFWYYVTGYVEI